MVLAVTDAFIFIELYRLDLTSKFFELELIVHTPIDVYEELHDYQQIPLNVMIDSGKLLLHNLTPEERKALHEVKFPSTLSETDKTAIFLAEKLKAILLSSDKAVRNYAKLRSIEYHGMLWILDELLREKKISKNDAVQKLEALIDTNTVYQNNKEFVSEMNKRIKLWSI